MKKILYTGLLLLTASLNAQLIQEDLINSSQFIYSGSARFNGLGGAMGALGGDLTAVSINPAGTGVFRSGQFSFTPTIKYSTSSTNFVIDPTLYVYETGKDVFFDKPIEEKFDDFGYRFRVDQLGIVFGQTNDNNDGWVSYNLAFTYNKLVDQVSSYAADVPYVNYSFLEVAAADMNLERPQNDFHDLAWYTYLINESDDLGYFSDVELIDPKSERIQQRLTTFNKVGEYNISFGANYSHKLYLGMGIGALVSRYSQLLEYSETNESTSADQPSSMYDNFDYEEDYSYNGIGINLKLGAIYRPISLLRLGLAVQTPTVYSVEDELKTSMDAVFQDGETYREQLPPLGYSSNLSTPMRATGSVALVSKYGLISADYEYVDYSTMKVRSDEFLYNDIDMSGNFMPTHNIRIGAEGKAGPVLLRAGYSYYQNPWKSETGLNSEYSSVSAGFGYHIKSFFVDFAYRLYTNVGTKNHNFQNQHFAETELSESNFQATIGFKF